MRPTIRQLEYIVAVAEEASFSRAAARCHVSQPSLSSQVRQLEMHLGIDLFERTPRGAFVTPSGRELVQRARDVLAASDRLLEGARVARGPLAGVLRLGSVSTVTPYLVPTAMVELRQRFPELELRVVDDVGEGLKETLERGELDVLLIPLPVDLPRVEAVPLFQDPFVVAAPVGSALAGLPDPLSLGDLEGCELMLLDDPHCLRGQALELCSRADATPHTTLHATSLSAIVQLVRRGLGATLLPSLALEVETAGVPEIVLRRFGAPAPGRQIGLAWRRGTRQEEEFRLLASVLMSHGESAVEWEPQPA